MAAQSRDEALADFNAHRSNYIALAATVTLVMLPFFAFLTLVMRRLHGRNEQLANQRRFLAELLDNIPMGISVRRLEPDGSGPYLVWNETNEVMYGVGRDAVLDKPVSAAASDSVARQVLAWDRELLASPSVQESVERELMASGAHSIIHRVRAPIFNIRHEVEYVVTVSADVTRQSAVEDDLRLASSVFETTADGIVISDADDRVIKVNSAFTRLAGFTETEMQGQRLFDSPFNPPDDQSYEERTRSLREEGMRTVEVPRFHKTGRALNLWLTATVVRSGSGAISNFVRVFTDISQLKDAQNRLEVLAGIDVLTGLPNRRTFDDRLQNALLRTARTQQRMGVLFLDLDGFKRVNDRHGHDAGDELLRQAASRLARCVRGSDSLCRLGGDEFTVIFENLSQPDQAILISQRILDEFSRPFVIGELELRVGTSIGIATHPENGQFATDLVKCADAAMYQAKKAGGNRFEFHPAASPCPAPAVDASLRLH